MQWRSQWGGEGKRVTCQEKPPPVPDHATGLAPSWFSHEVPPTDIMYGEGEGNIGNMNSQPTWLSARPMAVAGENF